MTIEFPCLQAKLVDAALVVANGYNPNRVARRELALLITSIEADGVTQPIVTFFDAERGVYEIVDGFHRWSVLTQHFGCRHVPVVVIDKPLNERMASTVRHNRARGKHQVDLQGELLRSLIDMGASDAEIATKLGMSSEEILRLKQVVGAAKLLAAPQYGEFYGRSDEPPLAPEDEP